MAGLVSSAGSRSGSVLARLDRGLATPTFYALVALLSFPTLETLRYGTAAPNYALDVFDADGAVPRIGATLTQLRDLGPSLWDPRIGTGLPVLGHSAISPIAPDVAIGLVAGPFVAYAVAAWLLAFTAGWGMHRFLRDSVGLPVAACMLGGLVYLFSFWHYVYGFAAVIAPVVIWAGDRVAGSGRGRAAALLIGVAAVSLGAYAGLSQIVVLVGGLHLAWVVVGSTAGRLRQRLAAWLAIWGLGMALYLPVLMSQLVLLPISSKTLWDLAFVYDSSPIVAAASVIDRYAGLVFGAPMAPDVATPRSYYGTWFAGALGIFALGCSICFGLRHRTGRFIVVALLATALTEWAFIVITSNLEIEGLLKSFQVVRVRHLVPFVVALGVAYGAARAMALVRLRAGRRTKMIVVGLAVASIALVATQAAIAAREALEASGGPISDVGWWAMTAALLVGLAALLIGVVGAWAARRRPSPRHLGAAALLVLLLVFGSERMLYAHAERLTDGHLDTWRARVALTAGQSAIIDLGGSSPGRTITLGDHPNRMSMHGLEQVDGYVAALPRVHHDAFGALIQECLDADPAIEGYFEGWGQRFYAFCPELDPEVLDLFGVRWIRAVGDPPLVGGLQERFADGEETVHENPDPFARAFLVGGSEIVPDAAAARERLGSADRATLAGTAIVIEGATDARLPVAPGNAGSAAIVRSEGELVEVRASATRPAILVVTDVAYPDWHVDVDGSPSRIFAVDVSARGVLLPAGDHTVVFRYRPTLTYVGFALAALALASTFGLALALARRGRRPS